MVILLSDFPIEKYNDTLADNLSEEYQVVKIGSERTPMKIDGWYRGCREALRQSSRQDVIISRFDFQAILLWWICKLTFRNRNIVCINIMLKDKTTLKNKVAGILYKLPLAADNFVASANSQEYMEWIKTRLGVRNELFLLHDVCKKEYILPDKTEPASRYVFTGGGGSRDWDFAFKLAEIVPELEFKFVMIETDYKKYKDKNLKNVSIYHDIPYVDFIEKIANAFVVCLPLSVQTPAGLIALFQAGANHVPVIITSTLASREYVTEKRGECLPPEIDLWARRLRHMMCNNEESIHKADNFYDFLYAECSEECYADQIKKMIAVFDSM